MSNAYTTYIVDGKKFRVHWQMQHKFLTDHPTAVPLRFYANEELPERDTNWFGEIFGSGGPLETSRIGWLYDSWQRGKDYASLTDEASILMRQGSDVNREDVENYLRAKEELALRYNPSVRMEKFMKRYHERGGGWWAFYNTIKEDPSDKVSLLSELFVQSMGTMYGTAESDPQALIAAGGGFGTGFAYGAAQPGDIRAKAIRGLSSGMATSMGFLTASMESSLTFSELLDEELNARGWAPTEDNIIKLLNGEAGEEIRHNAYGRGLTIGLVEGLTMSLASRTTRSLLSKGPGRFRRMQAIGAGVGVEAIGGGTGEFLGRVAADQEMDAAEIGFEAITGTITTPGSVGLALATHKNPVYKLNGETITFEEMKDFVDNASDMNIATANIKMENDMTGLNKQAWEKQSRAIIDYSIDSRITDKKDRSDLVELEKQLIIIKRKKERSGAKKIVGIDTEEKVVEEKIDAILNKYEGAVRYGETAEGKIIQKAQEQHSIADTLKLLETEAQKLDNIQDSFAVEDDNAAQAAYDKVRDKYGLKKRNVKGADGFIIPTKDGNVIVVNKDVAGRKGAINVGAHELLHAIIQKHYSGLARYEAKKKWIDDFKKTLSKKSRKYIQDTIEERIANGETELDVNITDEWLTIYSDGIRLKEISYNESLSVKFRNWLYNTFRMYKYNKEFSSGLATYNFMRDYNKNIAEGRIGKRAEAVAGKKAVEGDVSKSVTPEETTSEQRAVDEIGNTYRFEGGKKAWDEGGADNAIKEIKREGYLDALIGARYKVRPIPKKFISDVLTQLTPDIKRFNPEENDSLFGYLGPRIKWRADDVYKEIYEKKGPDTIPVEEKTKEGDIKIQVEAEEDTRMKAFEQEDLSLEGQRKKKAEIEKAKDRKKSKLRRDIGIETGGKIYNLILDAARQSLLKAYEAGTTARNIQRKLRDQASSYLFKRIKNYIGYGIAETTVPRGTKDIYITQLKKFGEAIYDSFFTADLVQLEKKVPDDQKVFTEFEKKLTRKADVEKAVAENKLPKEALNAYDKDKSVNLYKRKKYNEDNWVAFFDQPAVSPKTGLRSGLKGTRKDSLSKLLSGALSYDATPQVAREEKVIEKRKEFAEIRNEDQSVNSLETLAAQIHRDKDLKFSKTVLTESKKPKAGLFLQQIENKVQGPGKIFVSIIRELVEDGAGIIEAYETARIETGIDSAALDLIFKDGKFDNSHIDNIIYGINKFGVGKIRKLGFDSATKYILNKVKGKGIKNRIKIINEFLINVGRSARSAAVDGITTNEQLLNFIEDLGVTTKEGKNIRDNYRLRDVTWGKRIQYLDSETNTWKDVPLYENIENIKENIYKSESLQKKTKEQSRQARDFINEILDSDLTKAEQKAIMQLIAYDQRGAMRKLSDVGMSVEDISSDKTVLEHEITIKDMLSYINNAIDGKLSRTKLNSIFDKSRVHVLPKSLDAILTSEGLKYKGGLTRYQNKAFKTAIAKLINNGTIKNAPSELKFSKSLDFEKVNKAISFSRSPNNKTKGISILDFDDTLATTKSMIRFTRPDGTKGKLNAEQYAKTYEGLSKLGYTWDFSEFNEVVKGKVAPLFQKALKLQSKFGSENMFVLTARPAESAKAIHIFLTANGLNIPLKNITGLANSTAEAKALWVAEKVGEGYNDFYFADDALQNVQAVKNMLNQFDVKSKVQQARVKFSNSMNERFNNILEEVLDIESEKRFSIIKGRKRGEGKGKWRFFVPPSHEDFMGLLYNFMGKGDRGDHHRNFLEQALVRPLNRAFREIDTLAQSIANDFKNLNKQHPNIKKILNKKTPDGDFTVQDAIRVYLWDKHGYEIPGLTETDRNMLVDMVKATPEVLAYAENLNTISRQEKYVKPTDGWNGGDIRIDLDDAVKSSRENFFAEFFENADIIFSQENLNKIEAGLGKEMRNSIEDMLYRIKTGINRPKGSNGVVNRFMNFLNGSIGSVMFLNMRSALLQQMSIVNYINFADNNIFAAAKAFANQKQYWTDWVKIFNSDMLKQRRGGLRTDINASELTETLSTSRFPMRTLINQLLQLGFKPTQIGDSIAIATGGATFYRNRVKSYLKDGYSLQEAENMAWTDLQDATQSSQQSSRPDMVSKQQASWIGKAILNFQNITSQYNRIGKKAMSDIWNRRITPPNRTQLQSDISNVSRITYYFAIQNAIFYSLQTALFAMLFDDEKEEENQLFIKKKDRVINGTIDSILRGSGIYGAVLSTVKNTYIAWTRQRDVDYNPDESAVLMEALNFSPIVGIKARKLVNAEKTLNYNKKVIEEMETFDIDNPQWSAVTNYIEASTNLPLNRLYNKVNNLRQAFNNEHEAWQRLMMFLGWSQYNLGIQNEKVIKAKEKIKKDKTKGKKKKKTKEQQRREEYNEMFDKYKHLF